MKLFISAAIGLVVIFLIGCTTPPNPRAQAPAAGTTPAAEMAQPTAVPAGEEADVRDLVENFGKRLQDVGLLAPDAAQEVQAQYSEFVSPDLLKTWTQDVAKAPGRMVSSPWPDRIQVDTLEKQASDRYVITGVVVEITSVEVVEGGAVNEIPVRIVAGRIQGRWLITDYTEQQ